MGTAYPPVFLGCQNRNRKEPDPIIGPGTGTAKNRISQLGPGTRTARNRIPRFNPRTFITRTAKKIITLFSALVFREQSRFSTRACPLSKHNRAKPRIVLCLQETHNFIAPRQYCDATRFDDQLSKHNNLWMKGRIAVLIFWFQIICPLDYNLTSWASVIFLYS